MTVSMSKSKKHHFVPQFILRKFLKDGLIFAFNKKKGKIFSSPHTEDIFQENHLYSVISNDCDKDPQIETDFSKLESDWAPVFKELEILLNKGSQLPLDYLKFIQNYMYLHICRNPKFKSKLISDKVTTENINICLDKFEADKPNLPGITEIRTNISDPEFIKRLKHNIGAKSSLNKENDAIKEIENRGLLVAFINVEHKNFVIGDYPFTLLGANQIDSSGGALWYILSPKLAVAPYGKKDTFKILNLTASEIRRFNQRTLTDSTMVASNSEALLKSLARL